MLSGADAVTSRTALIAPVSTASKRRHLGLRQPVRARRAEILAHRMVSLAVSRLVLRCCFEAAAAAAPVRLA